MNESMPQDEKIESGPEHVESKIVLHFMRHAEKNSAGNLTDEGKQEAKSLAGENNVRQSVVFGNVRERTQHTAAIRMAGNEKGVTGDETFGELKEKLNSEFEKGSKASKIALDPRLDFKVVEPYASAFDEEIAPADKNGTTLRWLIDRSDALAGELGDTESNVTYNRMAAGVASLILKYITANDEKHVTVSETWDKLVQEKGYKPALERFMGTSSTLQECFLAKLILLVKGEDEQKKFVKLNNRGFDYTEGFEVEIVKSTSEDEPSVRIVYKKEGEETEENFVFDEVVAVEILEQIANQK